MSGEGPLDEHNRAFHDGLLDASGTRERFPRDAAEQAEYDQGKRLGEVGRSGVGGGPKQTLREVIISFFGVAGGGAGLLWGLRLVGRGEAGWFSVAGLLVAGILIGVGAFGVLTGIAGWVRRKIVWTRGRAERDADMLVRMWEARFGEDMPPELLGEIDDDGRGWTMDGRANFYLRLTTGRTFFVGLSPDTGDLVVETRGRKALLEDAYHNVLIHKALGRKRLRLTEGSKKNRRSMWAAASLLGLEVEGYTPDGKAVRLLADMKNDERFTG